MVLSSPRGEHRDCNPPTPLRWPQQKLLWGESRRRRLGYRCVWNADRRICCACSDQTRGDVQHRVAVGPGHLGLSAQEAKGGERETRPDFRRPGKDDRGELTRRGSIARLQADVIVQWTGAGGLIILHTRCKK